MVKATKLPSGSWRIRVRAGGDDMSFTATTKAECERLYAEYKLGLKNKPTGKTVRDCVIEYIDISKAVLKDTTISGYKTVLVYGFASIMDLPVDKLTDIDMQQAINLESKRVNPRTKKVISPKTVQNEWGLIASAVKLIAKKTYTVRLPEVPKKIEILPDPYKVLEAFRGTDVELPVLLALWCGLRASEIYGLTYGSIDGDYLLIDKTRVTVDRVRVLRNTAKTDTSIRRVKLPEYVKSLIPPNEDKDAFLINMSHSQIYLRYKAILDLNGIDMTFHQLRHEFATVSLSILHLPDKEVQVAGGWKTEYTMKKIYSNMINSIRRQADDARDDYFNQMLTPTKLPTIDGNS